MNTKIKVLAGALAAGAMFASAAANAAVSWNAKDGTILAWSGGPITDATPPCPAGFTCHPPGVVGDPTGDGDTTFTLLATNFVGDTRVLLEESEVQGIDFYNIDFSHDGEDFIDGTFVEYRIDTLDSLGFDRGSMDSQLLLASLTALIQKDIYDAITGELLLSLQSVNGAASAGSFSKRSQHLRIVDTIISGNENVESFTNQVTVPEPASLALFGIGLLGLLSRRRSS